MTEYYSTEKSNKIIEDSLRRQIKQQSNALGLTLSDTDIAGVIEKVFPAAERWKNDKPHSDLSVNNYVEQAREYILPALTNFKLNPTISTEHSANANRVLKEVLGRDATPDEISYFGKELAQGKSTYELSQELQSLPEYQKIQSAKDREMLGNELLQQQQLAFQKAQPAIISQYMRAGRLNSSGLNSALAQAQNELEQQRQGYLGQVGYQDLSGIRNNAYSAFQNYNQQFRDLYNPGARAQTQFNQLGAVLGRQREVADYNRQRNDYMAALDSQSAQSKQNALYQLYGSVLGAGIQGAFRAGK